MSKFCPIANKVTNCTDNCDACMSEEKAYTLFVWFDENEGGYGVCKRKKFSQRHRYHRERVGDFDTAEELATLIVKDDPDYTKELAVAEAKSLMSALQDGGV